MTKPRVKKIGGIDITDVCTPEETKAQMDRIRANNDELALLVKELEMMVRKQDVLNESSKS